MRKLDLTVPLNNDPAFEFPIKDERHRPINLGGAVIECYVKYKVTDSDDEAVLYKGVIITPSNQGRCKVSMRARSSAASCGLNTRTLHGAGPRSTAASLVARRKVRLSSS